MRSLAVLLLLLAAGLAWLELGDRSSPLALYAVEWEGRLGAPPWLLAGLLGFVLLLAGLARGSPRPAPRRRGPAPPLRAARAGGGPSRPGGAGPAASIQEAVERARALRWEPGVRLRLDEARGLPFTLELRGVTPERARRSAAALAAFLASIPTPPRVRLRFVDCPPSPAPRHKQVAGQLRAHFAPEEVQLSLTREPDGRTELVELRFARPDPRWPEWTGQA